MFNSEGLPDRILIGDRGLLLAGKTQFLVRSYKDYANVPTEDRLEAAKMTLANNDAYWVSTNSQTGKTSFERVNAVSDSETVAGLVSQSRGELGVSDEGSQRR